MAYVERCIGLGDWVFDLDQPEEMEQLAPTVLDIVQNPRKSKEKVAASMAFINKCNQEMAEVLHRYI